MTNSWVNIDCILYFSHHGIKIKPCSYVIWSTRSPLGSQQQLLTPLGRSGRPYHVATQFYYLMWWFAFFNVYFGDICTDAIHRTHCNHDLYRFMLGDAYIWQGQLMSKDYGYVTLQCEVHISMFYLQLTSQRLVKKVWFVHCELKVWLMGYLFNIVFNGLDFNKTWVY